MDLFLQFWAGLFYLLNKICFAIAETQVEKIKRKLKILGWIVYILGVPAWILILINNQNWIAAAIEFGGVPAMFFGLYCVVTGTFNKAFDLFASYATYFFVILGLGYSVYEYGGIASVSQFLEIGVMLGFLLGGYFFAKNNLWGWYCFILMNVSMGSLMLLQNKPVLVVQQGLSLCFVIFGLVSAVKKQRKNREVQ